MIGRRGAVLRLGRVQPPKGWDCRSASLPLPSPRMMLRQKGRLMMRLRQPLRSMQIVGLVAGMMATLAYAPSPAHAQRGATCQLSNEQIVQKERLRLAALGGDRDSFARYQRLVQQHAEALETCRQDQWPRNQALWIRLYPCDARPGALEQVLDVAVNKGYNQVYIETFGAGQVLLPQADNPTVWPSVVRSPGYENYDLLAEAIAKGHQRGLKVYAWLFSMNFGYTYLNSPHSNGTIARNGYGQTSLEAAYSAGLNATGEVHSEEVFIDPYNTQARTEYYTLVQSVTQRRPDGVLFDYIRYPRGTGAASVASRIQDLWVYGSASQQALYNRSLNRSAEELLRRYLRQGYITTQDIVDMEAFPDPYPRWQGLDLDPAYAAAPPEERVPYVQQQLWRLSISHAFQGVLDFLAIASQPVTQQGLSAGAVFFPGGNQFVGRNGVDSRMQPWDRFSPSLQWHPMSYATCGNTGCIVDQVRRVLQAAPNDANVKPVLAGRWGQPMSGRPALETQMQAIRQTAPQIQTISHFALSWQDPEFDTARRNCQLR